LLAERGIIASYESIRLWCNKFGAKYARRLKNKHQSYGDTFFIDEVFVKIDGKQHYLWRAVLIRFANWSAPGHHFLIGVFRAHGLHSPAHNFSSESGY